MMHGAARGRGKAGRDTCQSEGASGKVSSESVRQRAGKGLEDTVQGEEGRGRTELADGNQTLRIPVKSC